MVIVLIALGWSAAAVLAALVVGAGVRLADERERTTAAFTSLADMGDDGFEPSGPSRRSASPGGLLSPGSGSALSSSV